jgi:hypothetical protein
MVNAGKRIRGMKDVSGARPEAWFTAHGVKKMTILREMQGWRSNQRNKSSVETWSTYCQDVGSSRQVVNKGVSARGTTTMMEQEGKDDDET